VEAISSELDLDDCRPDSSVLATELRSVPASKFEVLEAIKALAEQVRYLEQGLAQERKA
jgi:hypothetical protein